MTGEAFYDPDDGAALLDDVEAFLARFVAYPSDHARIAHTLWTAHTHRMDVWESTPRIAFLSPEPNSGKTRALEVTELLVPRPVHAINTTPSYLFRKVSEEEGLPTILYDEIDTVFGPRAKDNEDIRGLLNAGHRKGAVAGRCVVKGPNVIAQELPADRAVALAGLDDLPDTLMSRSWSSGCAGGPKTSGSSHSDTARRARMATRCATTWRAGLCPSPRSGRTSPTESPTGTPTYGRRFSWSPMPPEAIGRNVPDPLLLRLLRLLRIRGRLSGSFF